MDITNTTGRDIFWGDKDRRLQSVEGARLGIRFPAGDTITIPDEVRLSLSFAGLVTSGDLVIVAYDSSPTSSVQQEEVLSIAGVRRTLVLVARGARGTTTAGAGDASQLPEVRELVVNGINIDFMAFDSAVDESAYWWLSMPDSWDGGEITFRVYWTSAGGAAAETAIWKLSGTAYASGDALDAPLGTSVSVTSALTAADDIHISPESTAVTLAGASAGGQRVLFVLTRDTTDTLSVDAQLMEVHVEYAVTSLSD